MSEDMPQHAYVFGAPDTCKNCGERAFHENHFFYREVNSRMSDDILAISAIEFVVVKRTPCGAWIEPTWVAGYMFEDMERRKRHWKFVLEGAGVRHAHPTRELARASFIARKKKEIMHTSRQHDRAVRYLALAETRKFGTRTEALHEIKTADISLPEIPRRFTSTQYARALAELTDCFLEKHGCFPLDNARWKEAMSTAYTLIGQPNTQARETLLP